MIDNNVFQKLELFYLAKTSQQPLTTATKWTPTNMPTTLQLVTETQREKSLDTLRGFAIIEVLFVLFLEWDNLGILPGEEKTNSLSLYTRQPIFFYLAKGD